MTGHANGLITLNVEEADDSIREKVRAAMREPYRTLLGHLRHEVGHYYWDRLVRDSAWLDEFRSLFGDERASYADALKKNYEEGPPVDWPLRFVSSYASSHPWEDWAETRAHYLHMDDTLDTALSFGLGAGDVEIDFEPFTRDVLWQPEVDGAQELGLHQRLGRADQRTQRAVTQHGRARLLPVCAEPPGGGQAAFHPPRGA